jgi:hypothetical protein
LFHLAQIFARRVEGNCHHRGLLFSLLFLLRGRGRSLPSPIRSCSRRQTWRGYRSGLGCWRTDGGILHSLRSLTAIEFEAYVAAPNTQGSLLDPRGSRFGCRGMGAWSFNRHSSLADGTFNEPDHSHRNTSKRPRPAKSHVFLVGHMAGRNGFCIGFGCERKTIKRLGNFRSTEPHKITRANG